MDNTLFKISSVLNTFFPKNIFFVKKFIEHVSMQLSRDCSCNFSELSDYLLFLIILEVEKRSRFFFIVLMFFDQEMEKSPNLALAQPVFFFEGTPREI